MTKGREIAVERRPRLFYDLSAARRIALHTLGVDAMSEIGKSMLLAEDQTPGLWMASVVSGCFSKSWRSLTTAQEVFVQLQSVWN